jgi:hypothetical protein
MLEKIGFLPNHVVVREPRAERRAACTCSSGVARAISVCGVCGCGWGDGAEGASCMSYCELPEGTGGGASSPTGDGPRSTPRRAPRSTPRRAPHCLDQRAPAPAPAAPTEAEGGCCL